VNAFGLNLKPMASILKAFSRLALLGLMFFSLCNVTAQNSLLGTTNLEFNFAATSVGAHPGSARSVGGVASLGNYLNFLNSSDTERDFVPTNVVPAAQNTDATLELHVPSGKLWVLNASLIGNLPVGARLEVEVQDLRRTVLNSQLETMIWWDRGGSLVRLRFRLWLRRDVQASTFTVAVQFALGELP
jgi:hypothetical protein